MLIPGLLPTEQEASRPSQFPRRYSRNENQFDYDQVKLGRTDWGREGNDANGNS